MLSKHEPYRDPGVDFEAMSAKKKRATLEQGSQEDRQVTNGKTCLSLISN